jgi:outer membrane lipoprotein LolB
MIARRTCLLTVVFCLLQACSTAPKVTQPGSTAQKWVQYQLEAGRINSWHLQGRAAVFVDDEVHNIGIRWRRNVEEFVIVLEAPFGQGVVRLESSRETAYPVKLSLSDGRVVYAEDAESALLDAVGFAIPLKGLDSWIRGLPMKTMPFSRELRDDGRLKALSQNNWQINYLDYFDPADEAKGLPEKMYLKHDKLALKIVIEHWQKPLIEVGNHELFPDFR